MVAEKKKNGGQGIEGFIGFHTFKGLDFILKMHLVPEETDVEHWLDADC